MSTCNHCCQTPPSPHTGLNCITPGSPTPHVTQTQVHAGAFSPKILGSSRSADAGQPLPSPSACFLVAGALYALCVPLAAKGQGGFQKPPPARSMTAEPCL